MNEVLTTKDRLRLLPTVVGRLGTTGAELAAYCLGKRGAPLPPGVVISPWGTGWGAEAKRVAAGVLGPGFLEHSVRTWRFGMALAYADRAQANVDSDLLYVAAMLHDIGLFAPLKGRCFTAAGVEAVRETAPAGTAAHEIADVEAAIYEHVDIEKPTKPLSYYLQAGSLLDVAGTRITKVDPVVVRQACSNRAGFPAACRSAWRAESRRFPEGRAAYLKFPLLLGTRLNPLPR
ncbi:HD domain-containing protein [Kribbella rubisoli]|uniref:HD domain-containing protein n=1 Tax=Kribbella rubisoli TaxID=3075929 RepID=A0A4Q7WU03_9ACTN|nr:HD domain-containing protein [Kribbella rubisoli]RZU13874.1 HD domain-containing protein [Kribbella rubisoli]